MAPKIDDYGFGYIVVDGVTYSRDLIILPDRLITNWWRREGHRIDLDDLREVLDIDLEYLVIGTGYFSRVHVTDEVIKELKKRNVKLIITDSRHAWEKYNQLVDENVRVGGAFHLTC